VRAVRKKAARKKPKTTLRSPRETRSAPGKIVSDTKKGRDEGTPAGFVTDWSSNEQQEREVTRMTPKERTLA